MNYERANVGTYIGVDPGLNGGLAYITSDGKVEAIPMPTIKKKKGQELVLDLIALWFKKQTWIQVAAIEKVHSMPKQGVASTFKFGAGFGAIQGMFAALGIPYILVPPLLWKKTILAGLDHKEKSTSILYVNRRYPQVNLLPTERSPKPHDGMAEAICLAEYAKTYSQF